MGSGNALVAYLDNEQEAYILNDYYEAYMNDFTRGSVHFPMKGLSPGRHSITVKAWDTHNNPGQATLEFVVTDGENIGDRNIRKFSKSFSIRNLNIFYA